MKNRILSVLMVISALTMLGSCEKEEAKQTNQTASPEMKLKSGEGTSALTLSGYADWICGSQTPCNSINVGATKNNRVNLTISGGYSNVKYTYYRRISQGSYEVYQYIPGAQFTCSNASVSYASGYLNDNTKILVFANTGTAMNTAAYPTLVYDVSNGQFLTPISFGGGSVYNYTILTTLNYKGKPCETGPPPCSDCSVE